MKGYWKKILTILAATAFVILVPMWLDREIRPGIDLAGGTILVYELDPTKDLPAGFEMERLITAVKRRLDPAGVYNYTIRAAGPRRFEVIIPLQRASEVGPEAEELRRRLADGLALVDESALAHGRDHRQVVADARKAPDPKRPVEGGQWIHVPAELVPPGVPELPAGSNRMVVAVPDEIGGVWFLLDRAKEGDKPDTYVLTVEPGLTGDARVRQAKERLSKLGSLEFRILANQRDHAGLIAEAKKTADPNVEAADKRWWWAEVDRRRPCVEVPPLPPGETKKVTVFSPQEKRGQVCVLQYRDPPQAEAKTYVLIARDQENVTGDLLSYAQQSTGKNGLPAVGFNFNNVGAQRFFSLTRANQPADDKFLRRLGILLDNTVMSAPVIQAVIGASGVIEGGDDGFEPEELANLIAILNAGRLPTAITRAPVHEFHQGPDLGRDTIEKGRVAIIVGAAAVLAFMLVYYLFAGLVANVAMVLNLVLVLGLMVTINATFTLPGLAGLVLIIGMSVDANVLIFERIREERARGGSLVMAIRNGYSRAFRTIVDANLTTIITALILYNVGTDIIKGFALVLTLGIVTSMFTALYVTRVIIDVAVANRWIRELKMLRLFAEPKIPFMKYRVVCFVASGILILLGMIGFAVRGSNNFNIDFTGGMLVAIHTEKPMEIEQVRRTAEASGLSDISVVNISIAGSDENRIFNIRTTLSDQDEVRRKLKEAFGPMLLRTEMTIGQSEKIVAPAAATQVPATGPTATAPATQATVRFAGGASVPLSFNRLVSASSLRQKINEVLIGLGKPNPDVLYSLRGVDRTQIAGRFRQMELHTKQDPAFLETLKAKLADEVEFDRVESFSGQVAGETQVKAVVAILYSLLAMVAYIWVRFGKVTFGLAAILALTHDVLMTLGLLAASHWLSSTPIGPVLMLHDFKIDLPIIGAILTIIGYSLNDTIVVFDRIREVRGRTPELTADMIDTSINQTLSRTILTSLTTLLVVAVLYVIGGAGIHGFAFCLVVGVVSGTYSSIFIASPILIGIKSGSAAERARLGASKSS